jgi:hypothetical protein
LQIIVNMVKYSYVKFIDFVFRIQNRYDFSFYWVIVHFHVRTMYWLTYVDTHLAWNNTDLPSSNQGNHFRYKQAQDCCIPAFDGFDQNHMLHDILTTRSILWSLHELQKAPKFWKQFNGGGGDCSK